MALPRLRRFAGMLAGDEAGRDALLRAACLEMLDKGGERQSPMPFERWALFEIHARWLRNLREHHEPITQARADELLYRPASRRADPAGADSGPDIATFLASLPPQQRSVVLLVYGEGLSYEDAARVLDTPVETIAMRASRALAALADAFGQEGAQARSGGNVEPLYPTETQASA